MKNVLNSE